MSVSIELLDKLKACLGGISDYRAAKLLGVNQATVSAYRVGRVQMSSEIASKACKLAEISALPWILRLQLEKARCTEEKEAWQEALHRLAA